MKTRVIVSAVIEKEGKLLFGKKRKKKGPYPDTLHLVGGGIEEEESLEEAIKREIREEANIEVEIIDKIGFDDDFEADKHGELTHYVFLVYYTKYVSGQVKAEDDIIELKWIPKDGIPVKQLNRPSLRLFKKMGLVEE